jgi:hypothetical protein
MHTLVPPVGPPNASAALHAGFLLILPRIELHACIFFRQIKCPAAKEDAIAETVALAWKWYVRLSARGKPVSEFVATFAAYAAFGVKSGRRVCGQEKPKDALSAIARQRHGFTISPLPDGGGADGSALEEALHDNTQTPVDEQVMFRLDFPAWRRTRTDRDRRVIDDLMVGERTADVASKYGLSPARVSQLRRDLHADWQQFCGGSPEEDVRTTA